MPIQLLELIEEPNPSLSTLVQCADRHLTLAIEQDHKGNRHWALLRTF